MAKFKGVQINPNVLSIKESATLSINQKVRQLRSEGQEVTHLGFGQSPFPVHHRIQDALKEYSHSKEYLPTAGLPELCDQVADFLKDHFDLRYKAKNVFVGPGSKELLFEILYIIQRKILIPSPSWVSYGPQSIILGRPADYVMTEKDDGYRITPEILEEYCERDHAPKLLVINTPNNPTGVTYGKKILKELAEVCRKYQVVVVSDEIYAFTEFDQEKHFSLANFYPEGTIVTGGLSKAFSGGGYRFGFLALPDGWEKVRRALKAMISETYSCVCAPVQYAALEAFKMTEDLHDYLKLCTQVHEANSKYLHYRFTKMGMGCVKPEGAFYLFPDFEEFKKAFKTQKINGSDRLCRFLLDKCGVATLPGVDFYRKPSELVCRVAAVDYDGEKAIKAAQKAKSIGHEFVETHSPRMKDGCDRLEKFLASL